MKTSLVMLVLMGIPVIFLAGSVMHFMFDLLGRWAPVGIFAAANESVWEHCKLAFWPGVGWAGLTYLACGKDANNFFLAVGLGLAIMPLAIIGLFYGYTAILGHHVLWIDILIFGIAAAAGQVTSYITTTRPRLASVWQVVGIMLVALMALLFALFSFAPPKWPLFRDGPTGTYEMR